jgi:hypothetical protein
MKVRIKESDVSFGASGLSISSFVDCKYISNWFSEDEYEVDSKDLDKIKRIKGLK